MKKQTIAASLALTVLFTCGLPFTASSDSTITLPLRFHIVVGLSMDKNGLAMRSWVTKSDIEDTILPEVNRIWRRAQITFILEKTLESPVLDSPKRKQLVDYIANARRDSNGQADARRIKKLKKLIDWDTHNPQAINIYLIPYLGETSQGNAKPKYKCIFVGQWSDKASKGASAPQRVQLTERGPYKIGSLSRTVAHEIGHILGLTHPNKSTQTTFNLLMGGKKAGYELTAEQAMTARRIAASLAE